MYAKYISSNKIEFPPLTLREGGDVVINFPENVPMMLKHGYYPVTPEPAPGEGKQWSITASTFELHEAEDPAESYITANWVYEAIPEPPPPSAYEIALEMKNTLLMKTAMLSIPLEDDTTALALAPVCPEWQPDTHYEAGEIVNRNGQAYRVIQDVDSLENQPPDAEGMLAVYRPLNEGYAGTIDDPIPFVNGMDVYKDKYYSFEGKTYLCKQDMLPCTWSPGTAGLWQWEEVGNV